MCLVPASLPAGSLPPRTSPEAAGSSGAPRGAGLSRRAFLVLEEAEEAGRAATRSRRASGTAPFPPGAAPFPAALPRPPFPNGWWHPGGVVGTRPGGGRAWWGCAELSAAASRPGSCPWPRTGPSGTGCVREEPTGIGASYGDPQRFPAPSGAGLPCELWPDRRNPAPEVFLG